MREWWLGVGGCAAIFGCNCLWTFKILHGAQKAIAKALAGRQQPKGKSNKEKRLEFDATSQSNMEQVNGRGTSFDREGDRRPPSFEFGERPRGTKK